MLWNHRQSIVPLNISLCMCDCLSVVCQQLQQSSETDVKMSEEQDLSHLLSEALLERETEEM